jgi:hypothetical protein
MGLHLGVKHDRHRWRRNEHYCGQGRKVNEALSERLSAYPESVTNPLGHCRARPELSLRAANKSLKTIKSYTDTVRSHPLLRRIIGMPTDHPQSLQRTCRDLHRLLVERYRPTTASIRFGHRSNGRSTSEKPDTPRTTNTKRPCSRGTCHWYASTISHVLRSVEVDRTLALG